ncbi:MAG: hypothetical protein AB7E47_06460 [Desulfovibrionaceae bacterium]
MKNRHGEETGGAPTVYVVHCVDTEGPLGETLQATFQRVRHTFGVDLPPSRDTLARLQRRELDLGGREEAVARMVAPELLAYKDSWDKMDAMLDRIQAPEVRLALTDSLGRGWIYNWFCVDHVGYTENPRGRDMGYHRVFDHYAARCLESGNSRDAVYFHYHPMHFSRHAHRSGSHYFAHADTLFQILARRIIDRGWFPSCNRAGFNVERPDSHWFLEQYVPFDLSNQSCHEDADQPDIACGRYSDWQAAPRDWAPYHPHHDDHRRPGACRRWIARCLNLGTRFKLLRQADVDQAFREAAEGRPVVLAFTDHDFREMEPDVRLAMDMLDKASRAYGGVAFRYCTAREAMRAALGLAEAPPLRLSIEQTLEGLDIRAQGRTFGPQPFLALKTRAGAYFHDNLDPVQPFAHWRYALYSETFAPEALESVGVAACDALGNVAVARLDMRDGSLRQETF